MAPILMQTILAPHFFLNFSLGIFFFDANKRTCFCFKEFPIFTLTQKGRRPNLYDLFTYAGPMSTLVKPNQMILAILIDQLQ